MREGEFFPPVQYSPLWLALGVLIIAVIIGWYLFALLSTRRAPAPAAHLDGPRAFDPPVREAYLRRIDDVNRRYAAGDVGFSDAHHELSALVRSFAAEARGIRAQYMTLDDLRRTEHHGLATTVEALYPGAFSGAATGSIDAATARASELVRSWN
ncbi:MAG: hypothetical protein JWM50_2295 [Microbacteriaceae bacterium]|jgi:hypothetical protein|nr:hypothetical protein [Microbacteriaceae bacterium]